MKKEGGSADCLTEIFSNQKTQQMFQEISRQLILEAAFVLSGNHYTVTIDILESMIL